MKKTVQGIAIAISILVTSQSAFAKASDSLKRLCSNAPGGKIVNEVRLSSYIESWTLQNPESYVVIDSSSNIYANSNDGFTSLQLAATKGHTDIVSYLRGKRSEKESSLFNALNNYYYHGNDLAQITSLINQGVNIDARDDNYYAPLHWTFNKLNLVQLLVERGADLDAKDENLWTTLHWAADSNQLDTVKYLVEKGADFNAKEKRNRTPYDLASEKNHSEVAEFLGPLRNRTALHHAAENGRLDVVKRLIKKGVDIKDSQNRTPLHYAAENGHLDVVKYLVENGANIYLEDDSSETPEELARAKIKEMSKITYSMQKQQQKILSLKQRQVILMKLKI
ncbi:ankyrin repeat domain-containing protein [Wolbachia pipientis]|nr:ankyrin repeat domain-containing protein [Wolbachia pipientis]